MHTIRPVRRWSTVAVLAVAAAATIATSAPEDIRVSATDEVVLDPGQTVYVEVVANAAAMDHVRRFEEEGLTVALDVALSGTGFRATPDDPEFAPVDDGGWFHADLSDCPSTGGCRLGFTLESTQAVPLEAPPEGSTDSRTTVVVTGSAVVPADGDLVFPEGRDFPDDAQVEILVDGE